MKEALPKKGFTFVEAIIVFAIIGIVAAITLPLISNFLPSLRLSSSARITLTKLRQAQEEAVTTQTRHGVRFNLTNPPTIDLVRSGTPNTNLETETLGKDISLTLPTAITNNPLPDGPNTIFFSADGGPDASGNIVINLEGSTKTIIINPAGVMKLQ